MGKNNLFDRIIDKILETEKYANELRGIYKEPTEKFPKINVERSTEIEEKILHPIPAIIKKQDGSYDDKDFIDWVKSKTGGRTTVKPIPGRAHLALQDLATGRFKKWEEYLSKNPKVSEESPEVQVALFERDVYHEKRDIEAIRKRSY
jgi:hypothetical protein